VENSRGARHRDRGDGERTRSTPQVGAGQFDDFVGAGSGANAQYESGLDREESGEDRRHKQPQIPHTVSRRANEDDAEWQCRNVLLKLDTPVHRHEDIIVTPHAEQQLAVLDPRPTLTGHRIHIMSAEFRTEVHG
jgi:hypothetical protein